VKKIILNILALVFGFRFRGLLQLANIAEGTHEGSITKLVDAALTTRYLLVKFGTDVDHIAANGASDRPLGICTDEAAAAEDPVNVNLLGSAKETQKVVASEAIAYDVDVFTAASGKVQTEPVVAGTYYKVGRSMQAASTDGDVMEIDPCPAIAVEVS